MNQIPGPEDEERSANLENEPSQELLERLERAFSKNTTKSAEEKPEENCLDQVMNDFNDEPLSSESGKGTG